MKKSTIQALVAAGVAGHIAGMKAGLEQAEKIALAAQTRDLGFAEEAAKDARARLIAGRIHAAIERVTP